MFVLDVSRIYRCGFATGIHIAGICGLNLFSTEIAYTADGDFVVVDYVNDPIDLSIQSNTRDAVPDDIVRDITERLIGKVKLEWIENPGLNSG